MPIAAFLMPSLTPDVTLADETFGGRPALAIRNATVEVIVVPSIGRVMRYAFLNRPNVLFAPDPPPTAGPWTNYGGDKVWVAPQSRWQWPPDPALDGAPFTFERIPNGVRIMSGVTARDRLRLTREIALAAYGTKVTFRNRLLNLGAATPPIAPWQVTQVADPRRIELPLARTAAQPLGYAVLEGGRLDPANHVVRGETLILARAKGRTYKFGSKGSSGTIVADTPAGRITMTSRVRPRAKYADRDSALAVYTNSDPLAYAELETMGPLEALQPRQATETTVTWELR